MKISLLGEVAIAGQAVRRAEIDPRTQDKDMLDLKRKFNELKDLQKKVNLAVEKYEQ